MPEGSPKYYVIVSSSYNSGEEVKEFGHRHDALSYINTIQGAYNKSVENGETGHWPYVMGVILGHQIPFTPISYATQYTLED